MTYRTFKITTDWLIKKGACSEGIEYFNEKFPNGLTISNSQEEMIEMVLGLDFDIRLQNYFIWLLDNTGFEGDIEYYPYGTSFGDGHGRDYYSDQFSMDDYTSFAVFLSDLKELG